MSSYKESNYKNSIFNSIINSDDNTNHLLIPLRKLKNI